MQHIPYFHCILDVNVSYYSQQAVWGEKKKPLKRCRFPCDLCINPLMVLGRKGIRKKWFTALEYNGTSFSCSTLPWFVYILWQLMAFWRIVFSWSWLSGRWVMSALLCLACWVASYFASAFRVSLEFPGVLAAKAPGKVVRPSREISVFLQSSPLYLSRSWCREALINTSVRTQGIFTFIFV